MNYEQKYKEALERAKEYFKANQKIGELDENDVLSGIFPELKESEESDGEKIREHLTTLFINDYGKNSNARFAGIKVKDIIAWLEKQDVEFEQEPNTVDHWQDVRERAAISAMQIFIAHGWDDSEWIVKHSIRVADVLVKKLKGEQL